MSKYRFDWDSSKNQANRRKHGITFRQAETAFDDENALIEYDDDHSYDEDRFILIGMSKELKLLVVCHCYRDSGSVIRIISARKANRFEENLYGGNL